MTLPDGFCSTATMYSTSHSVTYPQVVQQETGAALTLPWTCMTTERNPPAWTRGSWRLGETQKVQVVKKGTCMLLQWNVPTRSAFLGFTEGARTNWWAERGSLGSAVCVDKRDGSQSKPVKSCHGELHAVTVAMLPCSMAQRQREVALHVFNSAQRRVSPSVWRLLNHQSKANTAKIDFCSHRRQSASSPGPAKESCEPKLVDKVVMGNGKSKEETVKEKALCGWSSNSFGNGVPGGQGMAATNPWRVTAHRP